MFTNSKLRLTKFGLPILLSLLFVAACGDDTDDNNQSECETNCDTGDAGDNGDATGQAPTVLSTTPLDGAVGVYTNARISVTFSQAMDADTLDTSTFELTTGDPAVAVAGRVTSYPGAKVVFWADEPLDIGTDYTATITTGAESASGMALESDHSWTFETGATEQPMMPINLGTAGDFVILAKSAISTASASDVTGDMGISPAAASYITEFSLIADATNVFATSSQVDGKIYAADYEPPTPSNLTTAVGDMEIAFADAAGRPADITEEAAGAIGGLTLDAGAYKWGTDVSIATDLTLNGSATDVWIFQVAGDLSIASATRVNLTGGALAKNVFWQVSGKAEFGTTSHFEGVVMSKTGITLKTGTSINGRLLAQTAVNLDASEVVEPAE